MKLEKAIIHLTTLHRIISFDTDPDFLNAIKLGIEALKRIRYGRNHPSGWELEPLPGETKE